jgi:isopenicillin N synthase-like dioxygenase
MSELPIIDVSGLRSARLVDRQAVGRALGEASRGVGFFYVVGHDLGGDRIRDAFSASHRFFAQDMAAKQALSIKRSAHDRGYIALEDEQLDPTSPADYKEAFNVGLELAGDHPEVLAGIPFRGPNFWPDLPGWREQILDFYNRAWSTGVLIHKGFCLDLGLEEDFFDDKLDAPIGVLRLLHYPPRPDGAAAQLGAGAHTDYGNITLLATDGVAGLQVRRRDGGWIEPPHIEGALVCNIGDCLMRWTGDEYVSTPHRVVRPARDRYSIAFFLDPNPEARVETLPGRPARYPATTGADYLKEKLDATYAFRVETA